MSTVLAVLAVAGSLVWAFREPLRAMVDLWSNSPMYSYAYTVPFISAYLFYCRRREIACAELDLSWRWGLPSTAAGLLVAYAARRGGIQIVEQLAFFLCLVGVALTVVGPRVVGAAWAGIAYLLLMFPIWDFVTEPLHAPFQQFSAAVGVAMLRGIGVPTYLEGTIVVLPNVTFEVARACSGVNYLVAVIALGLPMAYLYLGNASRRILLVAGAIAVAAFSNALRVGLIGALAYMDIGSPLHGPMHVLHGLFVAAIGYVALFVGLHFLGERRTPATPEVDGAEAAIAPFDLGRLRPAPLAALAVVFWMVPLSSEVSAVNLRRALDQFPLALGQWDGRRADQDAAARWWEGADDRLRRRYIAADGRIIDLDVVYFAAQRQDREVASFRTADLHRGASAIDVPLARGGSFRANLVPHPIDRRQLTLFWYEVGGVAETGQYEAKLRTLWDSIAYGRSDGAAVMLTFAPTGAGSDAQPDASLIQLASLVYDALDNHLPRPLDPSRARQASASRQ